MRSLTFKLIVAFLLTSVLGIGLAAVIARGVTAREFGRFVMGQQRNDFVAKAEAYYQTRGSWAGAGEYFRQLNAVPPSEPDAPRRPPQFVLADQNGVAVTPAQPYRSGDRIPTDKLARGAPVMVAGRRVGTVIDVVRAPALNPREAQYLASTNRALALAALVAAMIALLVGILLARNLTRPFRDLTRAIHAMMTGELKQEVPVRSADELGELIQAFNRLSADLARSNELRRQMTADIAHELRTPLTVIRAYVDGLRDGVFKPTPAGSRRCRSKRSTFSALWRTSARSPWPTRANCPCNACPHRAGHSSIGSLPLTRLRPARATSHCRSRLSRNCRISWLTLNE